MKNCLSLSLVYCLDYFVDFALNVFTLWFYLLIKLNPESRIAVCSQTIFKYLLVINIAHKYLNWRILEYQNDIIVYDCQTPKLNV